MAQDATLQGWKAIAGYLGRDERTALRWAAHRGLPVHRVPGSQRGPVFASAAEIDAWLQAAGPAGTAEADGPAPTLPPPDDGALPGDASRPLPDFPSPGSPAPASHVVPAARRPVRRMALAAAAAVGIASAAWLAVARIEPAHPVARARYTDAAAKAAFLQASFDWNLRTRESLARAVQEYGEAIAREPGVPDGYVGLANTYLLVRQYGSLSDADAYARAAAAARAALALGPASADLHRALGFLAFWHAGDRAAARAEFAQALAMRPDDPLTHQWLATALSANGEADAALREIGVARELNPSSTAVLTAQGILTYVAGDHDEGWRLLRNLERDQPQNATLHQLLASLALVEGRAADYAVEAAEAARLRGDARQMAAAARAGERARGGMRALMAGMLADARARAGHGGSWFALAQAESLAGDGDAARAALGRSCAAGEPDAITARNDLWLLRGVSPAQIAAICGPVESLI